MLEKQRELKVYLPKSSSQQIGGGFTFRTNLDKGIRSQKLGSIVDNWRDCDVIMITGATMTNRDEMYEAKKAGKKIVFRIDNIPKDSRNRGTAFSRMLDFARIADFQIYQSQWARDYVSWWFEHNKIDCSKSTIIRNGVDTEFFYHKDKPEERPEVYLFVHFNRDENKRFPEAAYYFHLKHCRAIEEKKDVRLVLVGQFSPELVSYNFDFFAGEKVEYWGISTTPFEMGETMRKCKYLLFPAYLDGSPNTVAEALACGLDICCVNSEGGTQDVIDDFKRKGLQTIEQMAKEYVEVLQSV